jgi:streptogramin lyase
LIAIVAGACTSTGRPDASSRSAGASLTTSTASASTPRAPATARASPSTPNGPSAEPPPPARSFPLDNAPINIAGLNGVVWAVGDELLLRIDAATSATTELPIPVVAGSGSIGAAADALWIADWRGGHVLRLDPSSGAVRATIAVGAPVGVIATADGVFIGSEAQGGVVRIDPRTNTVTRKFPQRGGFAYADGSLWFAQRDSGTVVRVGATTGKVEGTIEVPAEARPGSDAGRGGCFVGGRLPDAWWTWCFTERGASAPVRIDPASRATTGTIHVGGSVSGGVVVIDDLSWFVLDDRLVAVDRLNRVSRVVSLGNGFASDNAVVEGDSLWVSDEAGRRIVRIKLVDLR